MQPAELKISSFSHYPPEGREAAIQNLELLKRLPLVLLPILLRELITYDWRLPAERRQLNQQFTFFTIMPEPQIARVLAPFREIRIDDTLASTDWVNDPPGFMERFTAWLWSTHQMDRFRGVADDYAAAVRDAVPEDPPVLPRLGMVVIGSGVEKPAGPLFRKLRPFGIHLRGLDSRDGLSLLLAEVSRRAAAAQDGQRQSGASRFDHWHIDGGALTPAPGISQVSYAGLARAREFLIQRIETAIKYGGTGPEELRSMLARLRPSEIGLTDSGPNAVLDRFQLTLLTEGAGTQIFATTFVQWAARECARRAQPHTLMVRYTPRRQSQSLNAMLSATPSTGSDPEGSLVDADIGAYYTWLSMRRLSGAEQLRFIVWFEGHDEAIAIGPGLPHGTSSDSRLDMHQVLSLVRDGT